MAGYKQTIIDSNPVAFWTFDGDPHDRSTRVLLSRPYKIIDEIGDNPAILHIDYPDHPFHGYALGLPSMIKLEKEDQASICFGYYGRMENHPSTYPKAFLEVPHSSSFQFPRNGSFTIEFMMNKHGESDYINRNPYSSITRPIIRKKNVLNIYYYSSWWSHSHDLFFVFPNNNSVGLNVGVWTNRNVYVVMIWDVKEVAPNEFRAIEKIFLDSRLIHYRENIYYEAPPNTNIASSWEIGGITENADHFSDRNTSPLYLDQIAIYDKALTDDEVAHHYKKIYEYDDMIINDRAADYFPFDEEDSLIDWTIRNRINGSNGTYVGNISTIRRAQPGPKNLPLSKSAHFSGNAIAYFEKRSNWDYIYPWFQTDGDYTIEFWFNTSTSNRGVLFSMQQENSPYQGVLININWANDSYRNGVIEFRENEDYAVTSLSIDEDHRPYMFNDGKWHHIVVQRKGASILLWLDAKLHAKLDNVPKRSVGNSGIMYLMGSKPGDLNVNGFICKLARYSYALDETQIKARYTYSTIYKIRGQVTLQGVPTRANIRVYKNFTGELINEVESDPISGEYSITLLNNSKIDLLVFSKYDRNVRYRAYGPITPSEYDDLPILV